MKHTHEPQHGVRKIHRNGEVEYIALCQCHPLEGVPRMTDKNNMVPEVQMIVDLLHRQLVSATKQTEDDMAKLETRLTTLIEQVQRGNHTATVLAIETLAHQNAEMLSKIEMLESRTAWDLVKRCFSAR